MYNGPKNILLEDMKKWIKSGLEDPRMKFIITQMINTMEKLCDECQADRFRCTFEPLCEDRRWLSLLIEIKAPRRFWPQFCYSRRREEIKNFLNKKSTPTPLIDAIFPLKDFFTIFIKDFKGKITQSNIDELIQRMRNDLIKKWSNVDVIKLSNKKIILSLGVFDLIVIFDVMKSQVVVNANKIGINSDDELNELLVKLINGLDLDVKIVNPYTGRFYIHVLLNKENVDIENINKICSSLMVNTRIVDFNNKIRLTYEIVSKNGAFSSPIYNIKGITNFLKCLKEKLLKG